MSILLEDKPAGDLSGCTCEFDGDSLLPRSEKNENNETDVHGRTSEAVRWAFAQFDIAILALVGIFQSLGISTVTKAIPARGFHLLLEQIRMERLRNRASSPPTSICLITSVKHRVVH